MNRAAAPRAHSRAMAGQGLGAGAAPFVPAGLRGAASETLSPAARGGMHPGVGEGATGSTSAAAAATPSPLQFMKAAGPVGVAGETPNRALSAAAVGTVDVAALFPSPEGASTSRASAATSADPEVAVRAAAAAHAASRGESSGAGGAGGSGGSGGQRERHVTVVRGGATYFVPESEAIASGEIAGPSAGLGPSMGANMGGLAGIGAALFGGAMSGPAVMPAARRRTVWSQFLPKNMAALYQARAALTLAETAADDPRYKEIPPRFGRMMPLDADSSVRGATGSTGYNTTVFKVISTDDGMPYVLRRVDGLRRTSMNPHICAAVAGGWRKVAHGAIIPLRDVFVTGSALFFVHDYVPGAQSLQERFLSATSTAVGPLPEALLWSVACQLATAIRAAHRASLSLRCVHNPARMLLDAFGRVRFNGAGLLDVLEAESKKSLAELQTGDLLGLGYLLLSLATRSSTASSTPQESMARVAAAYSREFAKLVHSLVSEPMSADSAISLLAGRLGDELDAQYLIVDALDSHLAKEADNGRLLRICIKMLSVLERGEVAGDPAWSEQGDRYVIKLLRDYIFHQVTPDGAPLVDLGHSLEALNRLDIGDPSRVLLSSRDGRTMLASTYAEARSFLNTAFDHLRRSRGADPSAAAAAAAAAARAVAMRSGAHGAAGIGGGRGRGRGRGGDSGLWRPGAASAPPFVPGGGGGMAMGAGAAPFVPGGYGGAPYSGAPGY